ncbi:hypothetical protein hamaS1_06830 [Moorella sp. Hama-1]|nr:hypothetical protein hamaS1_06830 [Moorella sp. Hama-1]
MFPGGEKGHIAKSTWKNWISRIKDASRSSDFYGLKDFQWKDLRSSAARDPYAVARFLGDKSFDVVQKYIQVPWEQKLRWLKTPEDIKWQQERNKGAGEGKIENEKVKAITPGVVPMAPNINLGLSVVVQLNELARNLERGYITPEEFTWFKRNLYNNIAGNYQQL